MANGTFDNILLPLNGDVSWNNNPELTLLTDNNFYVGYTAQNVVVRTATQPRLIVDANGNVGIGITGTPSAITRLHMKRTTGKNLSFYDLSNRTFMSAFDDTGNPSSLTLSCSDLVVQGPGAVQRFAVSSTGQVIVGSRTAFDPAGNVLYV